jgi:hypothetical protein
MQVWGRPSRGSRAREEFVLVFSIFASVLFCMQGWNGVGTATDPKTGLGSSFLRTDQTRTGNSTYSWSEIPTQGPVPYVTLGLAAYDASDGYTLFFGGQTASSPASNNWTWSYSSGVWTNRTLPTVRINGYSAGASMTYDGQTGVILLAIPSDANPAVEQTWEYHAGNWTELFPSSEPTARWYAAMAFDPTLNETVLFGGLSLAGDGVGGETWLGDTWAYSSGNWRQISAGPSTNKEQYYESMAYDSSSGQLVLVTNAFGGSATNSYSFTGTSWSMLPLAAGYPGGTDSLAYDPAFSGLIGTDQVYWTNQTTQIWIFTGGAWQSRYIEGFPVKVNPIVYDAKDGYAMTVSSEPTLNVTGEATRAVTWVLSGVPVGSPPNATIEISQTSVTLGSSITVHGAFNSSYGHTWYRIGIEASGCPPAVNNQTLSCTPAGAGSFEAYFEVLDQAGRSSNVSITFSVVNSLLSNSNVLALLVVSATLAIGLGVGIYIGVTRRKRRRNSRPETDNEARIEAPRT